MNTTASFFQKWQPYFLSVLRVMAALLFMEHGTQKLFGFPGSSMPDWSSLAPMMLAAGLIELVGGLLLAVGLFTRPVAFILSGEMAVAYFMVHATQGFYPVLNGGELAALYSFVFLYFAVAGGGSFALDNRLGRKRY